MDFYKIKSYIYRIATGVCFLIPTDTTFITQKSLLHNMTTFTKETYLKIYIRKILVRQNMKVVAYGSPVYMENHIFLYFSKGFLANTFTS